MNINTQTYLSAQTSINSTKLPAVYNRIKWNTIKEYEFNGLAPRVLDYGCGKYTAHIEEFMSTRGFNWYGYDLTWNPNKSLLHKPWDIIICSNVLNVIKEKSVITEIQNFMRQRAWFYFITVYEGDKSWIGRETKKDCWQRNETLDAYLFHHLDRIKKNTITSWNGTKYIV